MGRNESSGPQRPMGGDGRAGGKKCSGAERAKKPTRERACNEGNPGGRRSSFHFHPQRARIVPIGGECGILACLHRSFTPAWGYWSDAVIGCLLRSTLNRLNKSYPRTPLRTQKLRPPHEPASTAAPSTLFANTMAAEGEWIDISGDGGLLKKVREQVCGCGCACLVGFGGWRVPAVCVRGTWNNRCCVASGNGGRGRCWGLFDQSIELTALHCVVYTHIIVSTRITDPEGGLGGEPAQRRRGGGALHRHARGGSVAHVHSFH